jgi:hypothetical protein
MALSNLLRRIVRHLPVLRQVKQAPAAVRHHREEVRASSHLDAAVICHVATLIPVAGIPHASGPFPFKQAAWWAPIKPYQPFH